MYILLTLLIGLIFLLTFHLMKEYKQNFIMTAICTLGILQIILAPQLCMNAALTGAVLFFKSVFPSLFPFLIVTNLMVFYDGIEIYAKLLGKLLCRPLRLPIQCSFAIIVSLFCGYPLGAKYACDLYEQGSISLSTCQRLINIASNASPLFILGSVGTAMLKSPSLGYLLLTSNYLSCLTMGLLLPTTKEPSSNSFSRFKPVTSSNFGSVFKETIEGAIKTTLSIGGFVVIFSVFIAIIKNNIAFDIVFNKISNLLSIDGSLLKNMLLGLIEMTNGCYLVAESSLDTIFKIPLISFFLAFSGLSVISQVYSFTYKHPLSLGKYIKRKIIQGFLCACISLLLLNVPLFDTTVTTFSKQPSSNHPFFFLLEVGIIALPIILHRTRRLFHIP